MAFVKLEELPEPRRLDDERPRLLPLPDMLMDIRLRLCDEDSIKTKGLSWTMDVSIDDTLVSRSNSSIKLASDLRCSGMVFFVLFLINGGFALLC